MRKRVLFFVGACLFGSAVFFALRPASQRAGGTEGQRAGGPQGQRAGGTRGQRAGGPGGQTGWAGLPDLRPSGPPDLRPSALPAFAAFEGWLADPGRTAGEGVELARARRGALKELIASDPAAAIAHAVPRATRGTLPAAVLAELEMPVDAFGGLEVLVVCGDRHTALRRRITVGNQAYEAYTYGARQGAMTKDRIAVHGIAIDDQLALRDTPFRQLEAGERGGVATGAGSPAGGDPLAGARLAMAVAVGDEVRRFENEEALHTWQREVLAAEASIGPDGDVFAPRVGAAAPTSGWVMGRKTVLWLRADFPDDPGLPATDEQIQASMAVVNQVYGEMSRGRTSFEATLLPGAFKTVTKASVAAAPQSGERLISDDLVRQARAYDLANGGTGKYNPDRYDRCIILFKPVTALSSDGSWWSGLALIGGKMAWLNGTVSPNTVAHELGHNHGANHSHRWEPTAGAMLGAGKHQEYGDSFDFMGEGALPGAHLNVVQKQRLLYLDAAQITDVTTSGPYRLHRHDTADPQGRIALRVAGPAAKPTGAGPWNGGTTFLPNDYWVEFRRQVPENARSWNSRTPNGVQVRWAARPDYSGLSPVPGTYLLDAQPQTTWGADATLVIGETFVDPEHGLVIGPVATGGTAPNEWIDVVVTRGDVGSNRAPSLMVNVPTGPVATREDLTLSAQANDPDGDATYIFWDFGDDTEGKQGLSVTHQWQFGGNFTVTCRALDGKGGVTTEKRAVAISHPLTTWTVRNTSTSAGSSRDFAFLGGRFIAVTHGLAVTSPDGVHWTEHTMPHYATYTALGYGGGVYVAIGMETAPQGNKATALVSTDGATWTKHPVSPDPISDFWLERLAYGAGRFVTVGKGGQIFASTDGKTWASATTPTTSNLTSVHYASGRFVAVGWDATVLTSTDGLAWTKVPISPPQDFSEVVFHRNRWVALTPGRVWTSADAQTWNWTFAPALNFGVDRLVVVDDVLIASGDPGKIWVSPDGEHWGKYIVEGGATNATSLVAGGNGTVVVLNNTGTVRQAGQPTRVGPIVAPNATRQVVAGQLTSLPCVASGFSRVELWVEGEKVATATGDNPSLAWAAPQYGRYVATLRGYVGDTLHSTSATVLTAGPGPWTYHAPRLKCGNLNTVVHALGRWWAAGDLGALTSSTDGVNWSPATLLDGTMADVLALVTDGRQLVALRRPFESGTGRDLPGIMMTTDGTWRPVAVGRQAAFPRTLAYANGTWLALGWGAAYASTDGVTWTENPFPEFVVNALRWGNGRWVAVGDNDTIVTSVDGISWVHASVPEPRNQRLEHVAYGNNRWVAIGGYPTHVLTSADGLIWTAAPPPADWLGTLGFYDGSFIAGGAGPFTSADGASWTSRGTRGSINAFASEGGILMAVAYGPSILRGATAAQLAPVESRPNTFVTTVLPWGDGAVIGNFEGAGWMSPEGVFTVQSNYSSPQGVTRGLGGIYQVGSRGAVLFSTNGLGWQERATGTSEDLKAVAASASLLVAVGNRGVILTSRDGVAWTARASGVTEDLKTVVAGDRWVVGGANGTLLTSDDGLTWRRQSTTAKRVLDRSAWLAGVGYIIGGNDGDRLFSTDGTTWIHETNSAVYGIAATRYGFVQTEYDALKVSRDGLTWSVLPPPAKAIRALAGDGNRLWAASGSSLLSTSLRAPLLLQALTASQTLTEGAALELGVSAFGEGPLRYQWFRDGMAIAGATGARYTLGAVGRGDAGRYTVRVTDGNGETATSEATVVLVAPRPVNTARLINLSVRGPLRKNQTCIVGFATSGAKRTLVRGVGPTLFKFDLPACADTRLALYGPAGVLETNDDWDASLAPTFAAVYAYPLERGSKDAAILRELTGPHSAHLTGTDAGTVLVEVYDADLNAPTKLVNVSARTVVGTGADVLIAGFVVHGEGRRRLLIRGVGPRLADFDVPGVLADPRIEVFNAADVRVAQNNDWTADAAEAVALQRAFEQSYAFALRTGSKDAALLVELEPGSYTAKLSGADGGTGEALIEVYEVE